MKYIAAIDYDHLDNGMFLTGLARAISKQKNTRPVILHADSAYTERIMQSGVMRKEAEIRSQKDLNHRLVALFADEGISAVGINGYQRKLIRLSGDKFTLDEVQFRRLPARSAIILSCLVWDENTSAPAAVHLNELSKFLQQKLETDRLFVFNKSDMAFKKSDEKSWEGLSNDFKAKHLPNEFQTFNERISLVTAHSFQNPSDITKGILID